MCRRLVRGVHGLRGAIRVEVLTDDPEKRFAAGSVLHREGSERPADDRLGRTGCGRPGLAGAVRRDPRPERSGFAARRLSRGGRRPGPRARPRRVLLARGRRDRCPRRGRRGARDRSRRLSRGRDRGVRGGRRPVRAVRSPGGPRLHPRVRTASGRDRGRRRSPRPAAAAATGADSRGPADALRRRRNNRRTAGGTSAPRGTAA